MSLFPPLSRGLRESLDALEARIEQCFPLPGRYRKSLAAGVAELSRLLTSARGEREHGYLRRPERLSPYLRYFLPWNVYRLCRLLPGLPLPLREGSAVTDLGSGPLTFALALWLSRPELRTLSIEFRCVDIAGAALEAGRALFAAVAFFPSPWKIRTIKAPLFGTEIRGDKAALAVSVNVWNELFGELSPADTAGLARLAARSAARLSELCAGDGAILAVEPGVPRAGEFLALLRDALIKAGRPPLSPCTHSGPCPMPGGAGKGGKRKWCHFSFDTEGAPEPLARLSLAAGIPKERGVLSFLLAGNAPALFAPSGHARIVSDNFPLSNGLWGRYGCGEDGLILARGAREAVEQRRSGSLVPVQDAAGERDSKSGAKVVCLSP